MFIVFCYCVLNVECEFWGECKDIDIIWKEGCIIYMCKLVVKGFNFVQINIEEIYGIVLYNYFMNLILKIDRILFFKY